MLVNANFAGIAENGSERCQPFVPFSFQEAWHMRPFARYALGISAAAASFGGCSASSQSPFDAPSMTQRSLAMGPVKRNLLYVAAGSVQVFTYPRGKPVGSLGVGGYLCSDRFGNVFVTGAEGISYVWVFPHGSGMAKATLYNPQDPGGCSVDKNSENVAVADPDSSPMVIFPHKPKLGWRLARQYSDPNMRASLYCAYDREGDLFLDGYSTSDSFILVELPKGSSTFATITLDQAIHSPGSVQWDGTDLAIEDAGASRSSAAVIYTFAISGSSGHRVSTTTLTDSAADAQFLIRGSTVIGPLSYNYGQGIGFWRFPSGGAPISTISTYSYPSGETLSLR
jgi:hypothetical protein